jgi:UPF0716 family protein affecting phage T7 exclusion
VLGVRFLYLIYVVHETGRTYIPSLILLAISAFCGFLLLTMAIIGMLLHAQRRLAEEQIYLQRKQLWK